MKRLLLLPAFLILTLAPALAQVKVGIKAGFNASTTKFHHHSDYPRSKYSFGYQAGLFTTIPVGENAFIQPELFYARKAWWADDIDFKDPYVNILGYLNLPLLLGYRLSSNTSIFTGTEFGYLVWTDPPENYWNSFKRFELGVTAGIRYQFSPNVSADIRYSHGLTKVVEWHSDVPPSHYIGGRNRAFLLSMAYTFGKNQNL